VLVFDASTLCLLAKSDLLDLFLDDFRGTLLLPGAVELECTGGTWPDAVLIRERIHEGRLLVEQARESRIVAQLAGDFRLGRGEAEALALALEKEGAVVATDDRNAIRACKVLRLGFVTALAVLAGAVEKGLLSKAAGALCLDKLAVHGRYSAAVINEAQLQIGDATHGESSEDR
jgi:predicted nucleic acid-binding protein